MATFSNGAAGIVTDFSKSAINVALVQGNVQPAETVAFDAQPFSIAVSPAFLGRVISPLGDPLDGLGPVAHTAFVRQQSLLAAPVPGITDRAPLSAVISSGNKAIDTFHPLLRGSSSVVYGEAGVGKAAFAHSVLQHIARENERAVEAEPDAEPVYSVYVTTGNSVAGTQDLLRRLDSSGCLPWTVVVAAPGGSGEAGASGSAYLAPFTGAAIAEWFRDTGKHAFVVYDNLTAHYASARRISRLPWSHHAAVPSGHASLFTRCAQLSEARGGGSLTCLSLLDAVPDGPAYTQLEHSKGREMVAHTVGLADNRFQFSRRAVRAGAVLPLEFEQLASRTGHAGQGDAMRYYTNRTREILCDLREPARGATLARMMGVGVESDADALLDMHAKARVLLLPTQGLLQAIGDARAAGSTVSIEEAGQLGLEGLNYLAVDGAGKGEGKGTGSAASGEGRKEQASTLAAVTSMLAAREQESLASKAKATSKVHAHVGGSRARAYSTSAAACSGTATGTGVGKAGTGAPIAKEVEAKVEKLKAKLDPVQLRTLLAVQQARAHGGAGRKGAGSAAQAYFAAQAAGMSEGQAAQVAVKKVEGEGLTEEEGERQYDSIFDVPDEEEESVARTSTTGGGGGQGGTASAGAGGGEGAGKTKPSWMGALTGKPGQSRSFSTAASKASRPAFRAPAGRSPPPQLFAGILGSPSPGATGPQVAGHARWHDWQWEAGPHSGDPARTLLSLFLISHSYICRVPLPYLLSYERGLYELLSTLPSPAWEGMPGTIEELVDRTSSSGMRHVPVSSVQHGYMTLLDAALLAPVPLDMAESTHSDTATALHRHGLQLVRRAAEVAAHREAVAREQRAAAAAAERVTSATPITASRASTWGQLFSALTSRKDKKQGSSGSTSGDEMDGSTTRSIDSAAPPTGTALPPLPTAQAAAPRAELTLEGLEPYIRVEGSLWSLPPVWQAMHVAVAEYTRSFMGDPLLQ